MVFDGPKHPDFMSISALLYDLNLLHDLSVVSSYVDYKDGDYIGRDFMYRYGRSIKPEHVARIGGISKNSPLWLDLLASCGAVWTLLHSIEKVQNWGLNKQKTRMEIEKLRYETELIRLEIEGKVISSVRDQRALSVEKILVERLNKSDFSLINLSVDKFSE